MNYSNLIATNFPRLKIENMAEVFAKKTQFPYPLDDIHLYIESLNGSIGYTSENLDDASGSIEVKPDKSFVIYISPYTSPRRDIFTIAHELGHFVLHSKLGEIPIKADRAFTKNDVEREANSFAASFLMPRDLFCEKYKEFNGDKELLANFFSVSILAVSYRVINLNCK